MGSNFLGGVVCGGGGRFRKKIFFFFGDGRWHPCLTMLIGKGVGRGWRRRRATSRRWSLANVDLSEKEKKKGKGESPKREYSGESAPALREARR